MNPPELSENSDSSDEDYVPDTKEDDLSEIESDGEPEDGLGDDGSQVKSKKRRKHDVKCRKKQKHIDIDNSLTASNEGKGLSEEEKKKNDDDVWADFMRDTGFQSRKDRSTNVAVNKTDQPVLKGSDSSEKKKQEKKSDKVKIIQTFKFAGEEVTVEKEVPVHSAEATLLNNTNPESTKNYKNRNTSNSGGISGILNQLGKKSKITTLEKTKLDWDKFKREENLEEELQTFNKGKDGYLEKQDFLQRADLRRFEIEKEIRTVERNKRMNAL